MPRQRLVLVLAYAAVAALEGTAAAAAQQPARAAPVVVSGPPAPAPPATIARDDQGRATVRAVRVADAAARRRPARRSGLRDGAAGLGLHPDRAERRAAGHREDRGLAVLRRRQRLRQRSGRGRASRSGWSSTRCAATATTSARATRSGSCFDTFHDRRNAILFEVNPLGGRTDGQITNERQYNADWNPVWDVAAGRSTAAGRSKRPFRSSRSATRRARRRSGASRRGASTGGRTRSRT